MELAEEQQQLQLLLVGILCVLELYRRSHGQWLCLRKCTLNAELYVIKICEYWLIRRGRYRVKDLYSLDHQGWYWYTYGINFRYV